jgi:hypothetical protein
LEEIRVAIQLTRRIIMAIITTDGRMLSNYGFFCEHCLAKKEAAGGFTEAEVKKFQIADAGVDFLTSVIWAALVDMPDDIEGIHNFPFAVVFEKGRIKGVARKK